jgi:predicted secreted hydrolase
MRRILPGFLRRLAVAAAFMAACAFTPATTPREWSFPRDHGAHRDYQTEWWYYTGHLATDDGRRFGYELVFFRYQPFPSDSLPPALADWRPAEFYPAHLAITDERGKQFRYWEQIQRDFGNLAGADSAALNVWCGNWSARAKGDVHVLNAAADDWSLSLELAPAKPPVLHGNGGLSRKGPKPDQASHYYSLTRLVTTGTLTEGNRSWPVTGETWMDHEFFSSPLDTTLTGWDWFSLQLNDGSELMLYRLRGKAGAPDWPSGTFVRADGTSIPLERSDFTIEESATWRSERTGFVYPSRWTITAPRVGLSLEIVPTLADQELDVRGSTGVVYWEGSVTVEGLRIGAPVAGRGYVELTGYGGSVPLGNGVTPGIR